MGLVNLEAVARYVRAGTTLILLNTEAAHD